MKHAMKHDTHFMKCVWIHLIHWICTQVVWAVTDKVGCGASSFKNGDWFATLYTCNYGPRGNVNGRQLYKQVKQDLDCATTTCMYLQSFRGLHVRTVGRERLALKSFLVSVVSQTLWKRCCCHHWTVKLAACPRPTPTSQQFRRKEMTTKSIPNLFFHPQQKSQTKLKNLNLRLKLTRKITRTWKMWKIPYKTKHLGQKRRNLN